MQITVKKLTKEELEKKDVFSWPVWRKEVSNFDWHYDSVEECYLLEGSVVIETENKEKVEFGKGDFVVFPKGLSCKWNIKAAVKKHYKFM